MSRHHPAGGRDLRLLAIYLVAIVLLLIAAPHEPLVVVLLIGVLVNLLAAEIDRRGGAYALWLVRQSARMVPREERERWVAEWEDHLRTAGEHGLRPVLTAWEITLVAAPQLAFDARRERQLERPVKADVQSERFAEVLSDVFAIVDRRKSVVPGDREKIQSAFGFAWEHYADQHHLMTGEDFMRHPAGVAKICAGMGLDAEAVSAALVLHTVEDAESLGKVREKFGDDIANLADGVTRLSDIDDYDAESPHHWKRAAADAPDARIVLIKLADHLDNMRRIEAAPKGMQHKAANQTLHILAPLADRLGVHAMTWELEDLAFATLQPRKYLEVKCLVNAEREERERHVARACTYLTVELQAVGIDAAIYGRAKHFYSIFSELKRGRAFNEIHDLTAMRVQVGSVADCYAAVELIHSLWKPLPDRFKDYIAAPKSNRYEALHSTVYGPEGRVLEIHVHTEAMHASAEFGIASYWMHEDDCTRAAGRSRDADAWLRSLVD